MNTKKKLLPYVLHEFDLEGAEFPPLYLRDINRMPLLKVAIQHFHDLSNFDLKLTRVKSVAINAI